MNKKIGKYTVMSLKVYDRDKFDGSYTKEPICCIIEEVNYKSNKDNYIVIREIIDIEEYKKKPSIALLGDRRKIYDNEYESYFDIPFTY